MLKLIVVLFLFNVQLFASICFAQEYKTKIAESEPHTFSNRSPFALKTNLLFDAASVLNVELEVPLGQRFSIAGEWMFPWWLNRSKQRCLQIQAGTLEGRYWWGNRQKKQTLTGWFTGLYSGAGYYDLEWDKTGYQGELFIAAGVSGGFVHKIGKYLAMEYSLGIGVLRTKYRKYHALLAGDDHWVLERQKSGNYTYVGPTKLKVSLIWFPDFLFKKKGGHK